MSRTIGDRMDELEDRVAALEAEYDRAVTAADPTRSPEDVAETWLKLTDSQENVAYAPEPEATVGEGVVDFETFLSYDFTNPPFFAPSRYNFRELERVDSSDVPFSEVPADE